MKVIALVPIYNEAQGITGVLDVLQDYVDEVLLINDGSTDDSPRLAAEWLDQGGPGELVTLDHNRGMSAAIWVGYALLDKRLRAGDLAPDDIIVKMDGDGQQRPEDIPRLVEYLKAPKTDGVRARRKLDNYPAYKRIGNKLLSWAISPLAGRRTYDVMSGYCLLKAKTLRPLLTYATTGYRYSLQAEITVILPRLGYNINDDPVVEVPLFRSRTKFSDVVTIWCLSLGALLKVKLGIKSTIPSVLPIK